MSLGLGLGPLSGSKRDKDQGTASTPCRGPMAGTCLGLVSTDLLQGGYEMNTWVISTDDAVLMWGYRALPHEPQVFANKS